MYILISCHQINLRHFDLCLLNSKAPRTHLIVSHDVSKQTLCCKRHSGMVDGPGLLKSLHLLTWQLNTSHIHFCTFSHQCHRLVVRICCRKSFHPLPHAEFDHSPAEERKKSHLVPVHFGAVPLQDLKTYKQSLVMGPLYSVARPTYLQRGQTCKELVFGYISQSSFWAQTHSSDPPQHLGPGQVCFTGDPQEDENFCCLSLVLLFRTLMLFHLQEQRRNLLAKIKEKPLQQTPAARGRCDTQHSF